MANPLPMNNRCVKCGEWFHNAHACAADVEKALRKCCEMPAQKRGPATPDEAEELAKQAVGEYLTACRITDRAELGNYLMKLASVTGVLMAQAEGSATAAARLEGTAAFVRKAMPPDPAALRPVQ